MAVALEPDMIAGFPETPPSPLRFLEGGGEASRLLLARDWTAHPLGAPATWPEGLRVALGLVLNSPESMVLAWGPELHFFFNDAYAPLLGPRVDWAMGARFDEVWRDAWDQAKPIIDEARAGRAKRFVDLPWTLGTDRGAAQTWWSFSYSRVLGGDGTPAGLFIVTNETTDRVLGRAAEARDRQIVDSATDHAVIATDGAGRVTRWSEGARRVLGWSEAEMLGQPADRFFTPEDVAAGRLGEEMRCALETGSAANERWHLRANGERFWANGEMTVLRDEAGAAAGFVKVLRDRTQQRLAAEQLTRARDALVAEREQLAQMFEQAPTFMAILRGPDHRIERVNPGWVRLVGRDDVLGRPIREVLPDAAEQGFVDTLDAVFATGEPFEAHDMLYRMQVAPDAPVTTRYVDFVYQPLRDAGGAVSGIFVEGADVTARVMARQAAEATATQFRALAEALPNQVWTATPDGALDWFNARALGYAGKTDDAMAGAGWTGIVHPDDLDRASTAWAGSLATGADYTVEFRIRRADGAYRWHLVSALPIRDEDGRVLRWVGANTDIDDQKSALARTVQDRDRLWDLSEDLMLVCDFAGVITAVNPSATRMLGWPPDELVGRSVADILHPDDHADTAREVEPLRRGVTRMGFENRCLMKAGGYRLLQWSAVPDAGRVHAVGRDITDQRALAADAERVWTLSPVLKVVTAQDGTITSANPAWTKTLGWSPDEMGGRPISDFLAPEERAGSRARIVRLGGGEGLTEYPVAMLTRAGERRTVAWTTVPEDDNFYGFGRDITAEVEAAKQLRVTEDALRQSQKMEAVGQLTGGIAHDFNNLLQGITGSLEIIQRRVAQGRVAEIDRFIGGATTAANRAAALTHRLLAFSRRQPLDPRPVRVNPLVSSMEDLLRRTIGERIELELVLAGGLWLTLCDPNQLENAILNLAINARDAMPEGGRLTIETCNAHLDNAYAAKSRDVTPGQYVCLCVSDTGTGMTSDVIAKAFEPFFTTKPIGQGTGLGLSMIYGFARQSEGHAKIYSELGRGTTFKLYLPRHRGAAEIEEAVPELGADHATEAGEVVLVVEDEPVVRGLIAETLSELGYRALEAADGPAGLAILQSGRRIDLLITDIGLPGLNGRQVADAGRALRPGLRVLFMTGYAENATLASGFLEPGMAMITKPFAMEALATRIRGIIEGEGR